MGETQVTVGHTDMFPTILGSYSFLARRISCGRISFCNHVHIDEWILYYEWLGSWDEIGEVERGEQSLFMLTAADSLLSSKLAVVGVNAGGNPNLLAST